MTTRPEPLLASENDYEGIAKRSPMGSSTVSVVIPIYNRVNRLDATLAGLVNQTRRPDEIIVADDGSEEDVESVVDRYRERLPIRLVRQKRNGFGAGQARNLGASVTDSDVLIFIDSDCIPAPDLVERHMWWHRRAGGLVVIGSRFHLDGNAVSPGMVETEFPRLRAAAVHVPEDGAPDDWRGIFYRRNRKLRIGDGAFRAVVSSNMSVDARRFHNLNGFPTGFHGWGGEDTEFGWRLWNDGAFIAVENGAAVFHQLEPEEDRSWRQAAIDRNRLLMADRVPHRFYRKVPSAFHLVPRVSWIVSVESAAEVDRAWSELSRSTYSDAEIVFTGSTQALEGTSIAFDNPRLLSVPGPSVEEAIRIARGEFIVLIDGRVVPHRSLVDRAVRRFDTDPRVGAVRCAYAMKGAGTYRRLGDLLAIDAKNGRHAPLFAVVRRREAMKGIHTGTLDWGALFRRCRLDLLINDTVKGEASDFILPARSPLPLGLGEVSRAGAEESARAVVRAVRAHRSNPSVDVDFSTVAGPTKPTIRYLGWTGNRNLGDDAMLAATRGLMPWAEVDPAAENPSALMLGGGTLINSNGDYLRRIERLDSPRLERIIFGTGVRSPEYWGATEPVERWLPILESALAVTVRGPDSEQHLRGFGYTGPVEVIGDPALSLTPPNGVDRVEGRVVVSPLHTSGECWGGDDLAVLKGISATVARLQAEGREVVLMTAFPADDRWAIEMMKDSGNPGLGYVAGYADLEETLRLLASAELVIGERLHAVVLAAAMGTPFVAVEYRPKLRDFARSIDCEEAIVRTDEIGGLDEVVRNVQADRQDASARIGVAVDLLRVRQKGAAQRLRAAIDT